MHHRAPEFLGGGVVPSSLGVDRVGDAIVLQGLPVFDGKIAEPLFVVLGGVAAVVHQQGDQPIGALHRLAGPVDELLLDTRPVLGVLLSGVRRQRLDPQLFVALLTLPQLPLGGQPVAGTADGPVVLRAELLPQPATAAQVPQHRGGQDQHDRDGDNDRDEGPS